MESDDKSDIENKQDMKKEAELNINHDDLSDVSDLDESIGAPSDNEVEETKLDSNNDNIQERDKKVDRRKCVCFKIYFRFCYRYQIKLGQMMGRSN